jgi:4'-phosphopantetheinyl transferase
MVRYTVNCFSAENVNWQKQPLFEVSENTVHVWQIKIIPVIRQIEKLSALLHTDELARAKRYHHEKDRLRFITSRGSLRLLLGNYLKKEPADIEFGISPGKKPFIVEPVTRLHYNTSHTETHVLVAIATSELGIDVERTDSSLDWEDVLYSSFSNDEITWVKQSKNPRRSFYLLWTRKEALAKATGKGLQDDLSIFPSLDGGHTLNPPEFFGSAWEIASFQIDNNNLCSVAHHPSITDRQFFIMNFEDFSF